MSADNYKDRRKALGLPRAQLAQLAHVDKHILQLIELNLPVTEEAKSRVERALDALENDQELPDFEAEVNALQQGAQTIGNFD